MNKNHDFHEIFRIEALDHYQTSSKNRLLIVVAMETITNCSGFNQRQDNMNSYLICL